MFPPSPPQAAVICGCVGVIAEVSYEALKKRYDQGWLCEIIHDVDTLVQRVKTAKLNKEVSSYAYARKYSCVARKSGFILDGEM